MGQALVLCHSRVQKEFLTPLRAFLEVDIKNVMVRKTISLLILCTGVSVWRLLPEHSSSVCVQVLLFS